MPAKKKTEQTERTVENTEEREKIIYHDYQLVEEREIRDRINSGWSLVGGPFVKWNIVYQAVTKDVEVWKPKSSMVEVDGPHF